MLPYQIEILDRKLPFFLNNLIIDATFFAHLRERQLLSEDSIQDVEAKETPRKQILRFTELLKRQAPKKFNVFMALLKVTEQSHIFKEVNNARHKKIKHLPKSPEAEKNTQQKLFSDLVPSRLSTHERDQLAKLFVLKEDYEEMNEDKHIQIQENEQLQMQLKDAQEEADYERIHHQSVKEEYDKLKREKEELSNEYIKQKRAISELQQKIEEQQQKEKDYLLQIDQHKNTLENMEQLLQDIQNKQNIQERRTMSEKSKDFVDSTAPIEIEMIDTEDEIFENPSELKAIQQHIEHLRNTAHSYEDINQNKLCSLQKELRKVDNMIHNILASNLDEEYVAQTEDVEVAQGVVLSESETTFNQENPISDTVHVKKRPKQKQHKRDSHHHEKGRLLNIETELSVLKNRIKTIEEEREEQNYLLKTKEKQLKEEQRQVVTLRQALRSNKGIRQQHQHTNWLKTQKSYDYLPVYNPPQTTSIKNISFEPSPRPICESGNYIHMKKPDQKPTALSLSLSTNCLKTMYGDSSFPKLRQNFLVSKSQTTSLLEYTDKRE